MTDTQAPRPGATRRVRAAIILGLAGLALAIAAWFWLGNAGQARECPVQEGAATAIGDAAVGELAALNGTGEGRGYSTMAFKDAAGQDMLHRNKWTPMEGKQIKSRVVQTIIRGQTVFRWDGEPIITGEKGEAHCSLG